MRLIDLHQLGLFELRKGGVKECELDARILLEYCTGKTRTELFLDADVEVSPTLQENYLKLIQRRQQREPIGYILGEQEFWSLPFQVTRDVLIPRPETEFLLDRVLALVDPSNLRSAEILDLCCGSGVIAIVLALETGKQITASDISSRGLQICMKNCIRHAVTEKVEIIQSDLLDMFLGKRTFSLIVSNPPYIDSFQVSNSLAPEVSENEPHLALDGGEGGLEIIQRLRVQLPLVLRPGGQFFMEFGADQGRAVAALFRHEYCNSPAFSEVKIFKDYAERDRVLLARL